MKKVARFLAVLLCLLCVMPALFGCGGGGGDSDSQKIGVLMPSKNESRWEQDSDSIMRQLQAKGYQVDMQNAEDDIDRQIEQAQTMVDNDYAVLVIAAIDGTKLKDVLQNAADKGIKIISYDRLIMDTPNVDYYVTFDNFEVGVMQGTFIADKLDLDNNPGPYNIEIFAGSPDDNNSNFFYDGAMSILTPYIDDGKLVVQSGEVSKEQTSIQGWKWETAQERMTQLLNDYYSGGTEIDAILSPNDGLAIGIINALKEKGFGDGKDFPILTGQDCAKENVIAIINGEQSMSVFKDTRTLADRTVRMIDDLLIKGTTEVNDEETYDNGVKIVPTYICKPVYVDINNYRQVLIDSGYYDEADLQQQ